MAEYIEREALLQAYYKIRPELGTRVIEWTNILETFPTTDVQPVHRGKWDFQGYRLFKCTNCNDIFTQEQLESIRKSFPNYCPSCGADMRD